MSIHRPTFRKNKKNFPSSNLSVVIMIGIFMTVLMLSPTFVSATGSGRSCKYKVHYCDHLKDAGIGGSKSCNEWSELSGHVYCVEHACTDCSDSSNDITNIYGDDLDSSEITLSSSCEGSDSYLCKLKRDGDCEANEFCFDRTNDFCDGYSYRTSYEDPDTSITYYIYHCNSRRRNLLRSSSSTE